MGLLLICLAAITWGTTGTTSALIAKQATVSPLIVGLWRLVFALPIFWLWHSYNSYQSTKTLSNLFLPKTNRFKLLAMGLSLFNDSRQKKISAVFL